MRVSIPGAALLALLAALGLAACNTLGELEVGPCAHLEPSVALPLELGRSGGCLLVPIEDRDGQPVLEGRLELVDLDLVPAGQGIVVDIASLAADGGAAADVAVLRAVDTRLAVAVARYRTEGDAAGLDGATVTLPDVQLADAGSEVAPLGAVAGFHLVDIEGRRVVLLVLGDRRVLWRDLAAPASTPFAEALVDDLTAAGSGGSGLDGQGAALLASAVYAGEPALVLAYTDYAEAVFPGQGRINKVASGLLAFGDDDTTLRYTVRAVHREPVKPDSPSLALPIAFTDRLDQAVEEDLGESYRFLLPGIEAVLSAVRDDPANPGSELPCDDIFTLLLGGNCRLRLERGAAALAALRHNPDAAPTTRRGPTEHELQLPAWQSARDRARLWLSEVAQLEPIDDDKLAFVHLASAAVDETAVTVSVPLFFGCVDEGGYRACESSENDQLLVVQSGAVVTVWAFDSSLGLAARRATDLDDRVVVDAAPIDLGAVALDDARPLFALLGAVGTAEAPGLELSLISDDAQPLAQLAIAATLPADTSGLGVWSSGPLVFVSQDASDVRVYLARAHHR